MTDKRLPSNVRPISNQVEKLDARVFDLERRIGQQGGSGTGQNGMLIFSRPGALTDAEISGRWYPITSVTFRSARLSVNTAGSSTVRVDVLVNGVSAAALTLVAGAHTDTFDIAISAAADEYIQAETVSASGSSDAVVELSQ